MKIGSKFLLVLIFFLGQQARAAILCPETMAGIQNKLSANRPSDLKMAFEQLPLIEQKKFVDSVAQVADTIDALFAGMQRSHPNLWVSPHFEIQGGSVLRDQVYNWRQNQPNLMAFIYQNKKYIDSMAEIIRNGEKQKQSFQPDASVLVNSYRLAMGDVSQVSKMGFQRDPNQTTWISDYQNQWTWGPRLEGQYLAQLKEFFSKLGYSIAKDSNSPYALEGQTKQERLIRTLWRDLPYLIMNFSKKVMDNYNLDWSVREKYQDFKSIFFNYNSKPISDIQFVDPKSNPEMFKAGGSAHRLAVTTDRPGDTIYFNKDGIERLSAAEIISILIHELGHHYGFKDDAVGTLDIIGNAIRQAIEPTLLSSASSDGSIGVQLLGLNDFFRRIQDGIFADSESREGTDLTRQVGSLLYVDAGDVAFDLTPHIYSLLPKVYRHHFFNLENFYLSNLRKVEEVEEYQGSRRRIVFTMDLNAAYLGFNGETQVVYGQKIPKQEHYISSGQVRVVVLQRKYNGIWQTTDGFEPTVAVDLHMENPVRAVDFLPILKRKIAYNYDLQQQGTQLQFKVNLQASSDIEGGLENLKSITAIVMSESFSSINQSGTRIPLRVPLKTTGDLLTGELDLRQSVSQNFYIEQLEIEFANGVKILSSPLERVKIEYKSNFTEIKQAQIDIPTIGGGTIVGLPFNFIQPGTNPTVSIKIKSQTPLTTAAVEIEYWGGDSNGRNFRNSEQIDLMKTQGATSGVGARRILGIKMNRSADGQYEYVLEFNRQIIINQGFNQIRLFNVFTRDENQTESRRNLFGNLILFLQ